MVRVEFEAKREWLVNTVAAMLRLPVESKEDGIRWAQGLSDAVLEHLQGSSKAEVAKVYQRMRAVQHDPDVIAAQQRVNEFRGQRMLETFYVQHPEVPNNAATHRALVDRALSLTDDGVIELQHLVEASKLLIAEKAITPKRIPTVAETKQQAAKDLETFKTAAVRFGFAINTANELLVKQQLGSGYSTDDIASAIYSKRLQLSPVGEVEQQQRDEQERQNILEEILGARIVTAQDRVHCESMPLDQLRVQVVQLRRERKYRQMTGAELRDHLRQQRSTTPETTDLDFMSRDNILLSMQAAGQDRVKTTGDEDTRNAGEADYLRQLCRLYGWKAVEKKMGYAEPRTGGFVRTLRHEFDTKRV